MLRYSRLQSIPALKTLAVPFVCALTVIALAQSPSTSSSVDTSATPGLAARSQPASVSAAAMAIGDTEVPAWIRSALAVSRGEAVGEARDEASVLRHFDQLGLAVRPVNRKDRQVRDEVAQWLAAAIAISRQGIVAGAGADAGLLAALRERAKAFRPGSPHWPSIRSIRYAATEEGPGELRFEISLMGSEIALATVNLDGFVAGAVDAVTAEMPTADHGAVGWVMP